jgi:peptidoglycan-associated lipoprotein
MIKRVFLGLLVAVVMAGCSSVKLDDVPVEDKSASSVPAQGGGGGPATQSQVAPVAADNAAATAQGPVNVARLVYFDYDSYVIKPEFQSLIEAHARFLKANANRHVALEGHTDERGGREYNLALGQQRAEAVRRALELLGARGTQVESVSYGEEKPADAGHDEAAWSHNRRADLTYR